MPRADIVVGFFGFEVFVVVIEPDMSAGEGFGRFLILLNVVSLKALVPKMDVHVTISHKEIAAFLLRASRPYLDVAAFAGVQADLLRGGNRQDWAAERKEKSREQQNEPEHRCNPGMRVTIHAEHLFDESSWIA
jgi:hypothetical protein